MKTVVAYGPAVSVIEGPKQKGLHFAVQAFWIEREVDLYALIAGLLEVGVVVPIGIRLRARGCADEVGNKAGGSGSGT